MASTLVVPDPENTYTLTPKHLPAKKEEEKDLIGAQVESKDSRVVQGSRSRESQHAQDSCLKPSRRNASAHQ
eukprot:5817817-Prorocentrum_lima.AAC.1